MKLRTRPIDVAQGTGNSEQNQFVPLEHMIRMGVPANLHPGGNLDRDAPYGNHISVRNHDNKLWKFTVEDVKMLKEIVMQVFVTRMDEAGHSCCPGAGDG